MIVNERPISGEISSPENLSGSLNQDSNEISGGIVTYADLDHTAIHYDTKENWDKQTYLIAEKGHFYIYSDANTEVTQSGENTTYASVKIGDGTSYLIDMPYAINGLDHTSLMTHLANHDIHVTSAERDQWNNKVSVRINEEEGLLILEN